MHYTLLFWPNIPLFMCCRTFLPYIPLFLCCRRAKTQWLSSFKAMAINRGPWVLSRDPNLSVVCSSTLPSVNLKHSIFSSRVVKRSQIYFFEWYLGDRSYILMHMVHSISFFNTITSTTHTSVQFPNGESVSVTNIGNIKVYQIILFTWKSFVFLLSTFNLISVNKLTSSMHCYLIFLSNHYIFQDLVQ